MWDKDFDVGDMSPTWLWPSRSVVADASPVVAELAGDGFAEVVVVGPQLSDDGAGGLKLLPKRFAACLFCSGPAMAAD